MIPQNTFLIEQNSEYQHDSTESTESFLIEQNSEYQQ